MGILVYSYIASLDGFVADRHGDFGWAAPDEEVHRFVNELERPIATYLYGRRMYEVMRFWETALDTPQPPSAERDYASVWQAANKIVYSTTLPSATTTRTMLRRQFDPEEVRTLKSESTRDIGIGGPTLAAAAIRSGLVDEIHSFVVPIIIGDGTRSLPDDVTIPLELVDHRRFLSGFVYSRYSTLPS